MAVFSIYTYKFRDVENIGIFVNDQHDHSPLKSLKEKQDYVQKIFREDKEGIRPFECVRYYERKNKETQRKEKLKSPYKCKTVWEHDGIIVMMISNRTKLTKHENFKKIHEQDEPWCRVVFDNRLGQEYIAIEKNSAFRSQDTVAEILADSLRDRLTPHHVTIEIDNQYKPAAFWEVIHRHKKSGIQEVSFHFAAPNHPWASTLLGKMNEAAKQMHARPTTVFSMPDKDPLNIDSNNKELNTYVNLCATQGEDIQVKVIGVRTPIHIKKVKDKNVILQMDEKTLRALIASDPMLFDENYTAVTKFFDQINPIESA